MAGIKYILLSIITLLLICRIDVAAQSASLAVQTGHSSGCTVNIISSDNRLILTSDSSQYHIWDINLGKQLFSFPRKVALTDPFKQEIGNGEALNIKGDSIWISTVTSGIRIPENAARNKSEQNDPSSLKVVFNKFWLRVIDPVSGKQKYKKMSEYYEYGFNDAAISLKHDLLLAACEDSHIYAYRLGTGKSLGKLADHLASVLSIKFSPDNSIFVSGSEDRSVIIWDSKTLKPLKRLSGNVYRKSAVAFSEDGNYLFVGDEFGGITRLNLDPEKLETQYYRIHNATVNDIQIINNTEVASCGDDNTIRIFNSATLKQVKVYIFHKFRPSFRYSKSIKALEQGFSVLIYSKADSIRVKENSLIVSGTIRPINYILGNLWKDRTKIIPLQNISSSINEMSSLEKNYEIRLTDLIHKLPSGKEITITGHTSRITGYALNIKKRILATSSNDGSVKLWDMDTDSLLATLILTGDRKMLINPEKYFMGDRSIFGRIGYRIGDKYYSPEQFDLKYNRPDLVLESLKFPGTDIIRMYHLAYDKRLKKSGFTSEILGSDFHLPQTTILNVNQLPLVTSEPVVKLSIVASDTKYSLDRINVWVNDVPLLGTRGYREILTGKKQAFHDFSIPLSSGTNKIQVSCVNSKGAESLRETYSVAYNPQKRTAPALYIIAISSSEYKQNSFNLRYAVKDGRDLALQFAGSKEFSKIIIDTLFNRNATRENVEKLKKKLLNTTVDDHVILFVSGHGLLSNDYDFYFATYDMDFSRPEKSGLSYDYLEGLLDSIPARKKLFMMDACHSGEVDKDQLVTVTEKADDIRFRSGVKVYSYKQDVTNRGGGENVGLNNSFGLMQQYFTNLNRGSGAVVISAAAGDGYALESDQWRNGVFTYSVLDGIRYKKADRNKDGLVSVSELRDFVFESVQDLTKGMQKPTSRQENLENDFAIWKYK